MSEDTMSDAKVASVPARFDGLYHKSLNGEKNCGAGESTQPELLDDIGLVVLPGCCI